MQLYKSLQFCKEVPKNAFGQTLRVEFSRDIQPWGGHFAWGLYWPWIELQILAMDSLRNSDLFKKKSYKIRPLFPEL